MTAAAVEDRSAPAATVRAAGRSVWALVDQAVLSGGNFLTTFVVVRALPPEVFGRYGLVLSFVLFLNNLHSALVAYPMTVLAAVGDGADLGRHARRGLGLTLGLSVPLMAVLAIATTVSAGGAVAFWAVVAMLVWQLQETARRAMMARLQNKRAIAGDAVSYVGQAGVVLVITVAGRLTVPVAFATVAASSAIGLALQAWQLGLHRKVPPGPPVGETVERHWSLGKWVLASNLVAVLTFYCGPWVLNYTHGPVEFAMLTVVATLLNASNPVLSTVAALVTPAAARANAAGGPAAAARASVPYALIGLVLLVPYYGLLAVAPRWVLSVVKPHSVYTELSGPVRVYVLIYFLLFGSQVLAGYLCGLGKSRLPFYAQAVAAVVTAVVTLPLVVRYGVWGAAWGGVAAMAAQSSVCGWFVRKSIRDCAE